MSSNTTAQLQITDMHCTSCAFNIDFTLEDLPGIQSAQTHYAQQKLTVVFDPQKITLTQIIAQIAELGYNAHKIV